MKTKVIFRKWKAPQSGILAIFPEEPCSYSGHLCSSYETIGQHGPCDPWGCVNETTKPTKAECEPLRKELKRIGYDLKECVRMSASFYETRKQRLAEGKA